MFKLLGLLVGCYTVYGALKGEVYAKAGTKWRMVARVEAPEYFWILIVLYAGLALALMTVF